MKILTNRGSIHSRINSVKKLIGHILDADKFIDKQAGVLLADKADLCTELLNSQVVQLLLGDCPVFCNVVHIRDSSAWDHGCR